MTVVCTPTFTIVVGLAVGSVRCESQPPDYFKRLSSFIDTITAHSHMRGAVQFNLADEYDMSTVGMAGSSGAVANLVFVACYVLLFGCVTAVTDTSYSFATLRSLMLMLDVDAVASVIRVFV